MDLQKQLMTIILASAVTNREHFEKAIEIKNLQQMMRKRGKSSV